MSHLPTSFEIHVHGDVPLRTDITAAQVEEALRPLWQYVGARSLKGAAASNFEEEPGIRFDARGHMLSICWTLSGNDDFRFACNQNRVNS